MGIIKFILRIVTIIAFIMMGLMVIIKYIEPSTMPLVSALSHFAPIIIITNGFLLVFWIIMWDKISIVAAIVFIACSGTISLYYQVGIKKDPNTQKSDIKIMTYNVGVFERSENAVDSIVDVINKYNPDIVCLQEFRTTKEYDLSYINSKLPRMRYRYIRYLTVTNKDSRKYGSGMAIYSKYRLINGQSERFEGSSNGYISADVIMRKDTFKIINMHLQSSSINPNDVYDAIAIEDKQKTIGLVKMLSSSSIKRAEQAHKIAEEVKLSPYPVILCGDLNDTPASYTYRIAKGDFKDAFVERGEGLAYTYNGMLSLLRIDAVFVDDNRFKVLKYYSDPLRYSDHNPVIVELEKKAVERNGASRTDKN